MNLKQIKLLILDVDGVLTDGKLYYSAKGEEMKTFNVKDGMGVKLLMDKGITVAIISAGSHFDIVKARADVLGIKHVSVDSTSKKQRLIDLAQILEVPYINIAYIGDDVNDLPAMDLCGLSICPADANKSVQVKADLILKENGGEGCVREFADLLLESF